VPLSFWAVGALRRGKLFALVFYLWFYLCVEGKEGEGRGCDDTGLGDWSEKVSARMGAYVFV
jgi:hypothetical protein